MDPKIKILLVEDNLTTRALFRQTILTYETLELCAETGSEQEGLRLLQEEQPDVVILDLELAEGTGMNFAREMRLLPINQPFTVVTTNNCSESIGRYLCSELKVDFIFQKENVGYNPNQVLDTISLIYKFHKSPCDHVTLEHNTLDRLIRQELKKMGFLDKYSGTEYIAETLLYTLEHPDDTIHLSKVIYPLLAQRHECDSSTIERSMRTCIERVWTNISPSFLSTFYPFTVTSANGRPTNSEFIRNMKTKLLRK